MKDRASKKQSEYVCGNALIRSLRKRIVFFMVFIVCLFGGCGQVQREVRGETGIKEEPGSEEESMTDKEPVTQALPDNDSIKESIYDYYGKEDHEEINEEEMEAVKGKLPAYFLTVHSGEEFALMREWYDWDSVQSLIVYFSGDLKEWQEEDLLALKQYHGSVTVESDAGTVPARAFTYLTGAQEVYLFASTDVSDVTGILPEGACFPTQMKAVTLFGYQEGKYAKLLRLLQDSQVETMTVIPDARTEETQNFWLDDVAGIGTLKVLTLQDIAIRIRDETALDGSEIERIEGFIDQDTDLCFVERLAHLEEITSRIVDVRDLSPLMERKELALYLEFYKKTKEFSQEDYGGSNYTVCPDFERMVSLPGEAEDNRFLGIYQRREDQGRVAECFIIDRFSEASDQEGELRMMDTEPWIRVTEGSAVYELRPEEGYGFLAGIRNRMTFEDINFDGVKDIVLEAGSYGTQALTYKYGWIWEQTSGRYEFSPAFAGIGNPVIDAEQQLVRSSWRNWAASHSWAIYRYVDGQFVMQGKLTEEPLFEEDIPPELEVPEDAEVWRWQEEIMEDGEVAEVINSYAIEAEGEETIYTDSERYESYYAKDSYWG